MDKLKKHIENNRSELDRIEQPDRDKIWKGIQAQLGAENKPKKDTLSTNFKPKKQASKPKVGRRFTLWAMATAASIALLIGIGIGHLTKEDTVVIPEFNLANYAPELKQQELVFQKLVSQKMNEIDVQNIDKRAYTEIFEELEELEGEYENWTKDVPQYVQEQELLEFLTRHYEQKIRILEILSKEIEKKAHAENREINL